MSLWHRGHTWGFFFILLLTAYEGRCFVVLMEDKKQILSWGVKAARTLYGIARLG